jgi:hypothetical protein
MNLFPQNAIEIMGQAKHSETGETTWTPRLLVEGRLWAQRGCRQGGRCGLTSPNLLLVRMCTCMFGAWSTDEVTMKAEPCFGLPGLR